MEPFEPDWFLQDDDGEEEPAAQTTNYSRSISNPVYEAGPEPAGPESSRFNGSGATGSLEPSVQVGRVPVVLLRCTAET